MDKSIITMLFNAYLFFLTFLTAVNFFTYNLSYHKVVLFFSIFLACLPAFLITLNKIRWIFFAIIINFFALVIVFISSFRIVRDALPPTRIGNEKIIGYTQYFGYPFYLDTVIFFIFIFYSVVFFLIIKLLRKKNSKK